jgi:hypothetical protein
MPKKIEPQSYEVLGTPYDANSDQPAVMMTVAQELRAEFCNAVLSVGVGLQGDRMIVRCHTVERYLGLPNNLKVTHDMCQKHVDAYVRKFKTEYRKRYRSALDAKEIKELRDYSCERISINEVYQFSCVRVYEFTLEAGAED